MKKIKNKEKSLCCGSNVKVIGDITMHYECLKCHQPCDIYIKERKLWQRKPQTQIQQDKRENHKKLFTEKELREFRMNEDF